MQQHDRTDTFLARLERLEHLAQHAREIEAAEDAAGFVARIDSARAPGDLGAAIIAAAKARSTRRRRR